MVIPCETIDNVPVPQSRLNSREYASTDQPGQNNSPTNNGLHFDQRLKRQSERHDT